MGREKSAQPIIELAIDDQMNPICGSLVFDPVRQTKIQKPAIAQLHFNPLSIEKELHLRISGDGNVQANLSRFKR